MIVVEGLRKRRGRTEVLRGMTFTARPGEVTLLLGPNGAGKSTTLALLAGLIRPGGGTAVVAGTDALSRHPDVARRISFLPQTPDFHPRLTCGRLVGSYARLRGIDPARALEALDRTGLRDRHDQAAGTLSGGMKQRLGLAVLLLADTPVLILDEPGLSLDPAWRRRLQMLLREEAARGKTILVTTHLVAEWNGQADRCLLCEDGRVIGELDPASLGHDLAASPAADPEGKDAPSAPAIARRTATPAPRPHPEGPVGGGAPRAPDGGGGGGAGASRPLSALMVRELAGVRASRVVQVFAVLALGGGVMATSSSDVAGAAPFLLLQIALHAVTLFAILAGVGAARSESEEWPLLFAQPGYRTAAVPAKFLACLTAFVLAVPLLFLPAALRGNPVATLATLGAQTVGVSAAFIAAGLAVGYLLRDRVQALLGGVLVWLATVFAYDALALAAVRWTPLREVPGIWVALLMLNPLDAFRVQALFSLEQIPPEAAGEHPVARWWIARSLLWSAMVSTAWTAGLLALAMRRCRRLEI